MGRILLIEPDAELAETYCNALMYMGHEVHRVSGAQEAIDIADHNKPELVIVEIQLATHNGIEFLYEFRTYPEWQTVPIVVLSMIPPTEFKHATSLWRELAVGAYHYKPRTSLRQLVSSVDRLLQFS